MLTQKQEKFVQELIKGKSQREAYREAYPKSKEWKDASVDQKACVLLKNVKVMSRYKELNQGAISKAQNDAESMRAFIIETYQKIASGEICEKSEEFDADGKLVRQKKTVRPNDVNNAIAKLAEYYNVSPEISVQHDVNVIFQNDEKGYSD